MNAKAMIPLVAGLGIGGVALKLGLSTVQKARAGQQTAPRVQVWVAKEDIPRGSKIQEDMLQSIPFPADVLPAGASSVANADGTELPPATCIRPSEAAPVCRDAAVRQEGSKVPKNHGSPQMDCTPQVHSTSFQPLAVATKKQAATARYTRNQPGMADVRPRSRAALSGRRGS